MNHHVTDELLEAVWKCREDGQTTVVACLQATHAEVNRDSIKNLVEQGQITLDGETIALPTRASGMRPMSFGVTGWPSGCSLTY